MATSSLQPHSSNPFRDPNRSPTITPQATGTSTHSHNPFLSPVERVTPQATGGSQYFTPQPTGAGALTPPAIGALTPQATGALAFSTPPTAPLETQNTGTHPTSSPPPVPQTSTRPSPSKGYAAPAGPPPSQNTPSPTPNPTPAMASTSGFAPPPGSPPQRSTYAPPPGPPPQSQSASPRAPSPAPTIVTEPPPPYTPAADVRHGEVPLETGPRRAYAPEWHPDGQVWRNEAALAAAGNSPSPRREEPQSRPNVVVSQPTGGGSSSWSAYPGQNRPPPRHPTLSSSPTLGRSNTTVGTSSVSRAQPGPPTTVPTPGRALLNQGKVLAYPAMYECDKCHLTGYVAYDPSNPCRQCWSLFAQPYEGALTYAPWDSPEDVTSDQQNLQRPLPGASARPPPSAPGPSSRPLSHPQHSSYAGLGHPPGSLPPADWSRPSTSTSLRPSASMSYPSRPSFPGRPSGISYAGRPPPGALVVRPGDPRIGGRVCWKCSGDGWQYKSLGLETKTCSACNGLGRLF